ncbi:riboflavin synthase subunit alpha [Zooshikella ganghwensis]|uniref:Riboflavin synthase n=1 Tax=Zooshikella ganghwensis TaxID=202772 RepID=A0A4P9VNG9_9GAMM|nr:riboflavin synthase subunit alpha [Zooshikella ganghwensis]RDH43492.1 riboflavin synthase subunit alpha [Zooshikella ganghwensis]
MFTGIIQSVAIIRCIHDHDSIRTFEIEFPEGFCKNLTIGASIAVDGVCLTVTEILTETVVKFDVILQSLLITTLAEHEKGDRVNVERAAKEGAEIGGHPLSGHVDFRTAIVEISEMEGNCRIRFDLPESWRKYIFPKGYIAINGASLTVSEVDKEKGYFEVWLIPETRRMTTFEEKRTGDNVNIEIERGTQVVVDTIQTTLEDSLGKLYPVLEQLLKEKGIDLQALTTSKLALLQGKKMED